jgi:hypothetical protein
MATIEHFASDVYTTEWAQPVVCTLYLLGLCGLTGMLMHRVPKWGEWRGISAARLAIVFILADSYALWVHIVGVTVLTLTPRFIFVYIAALLTRRRFRHLATDATERSSSRTGPSRRGNITLCLCTTDFT